MTTEYVNGILEKSTSAGDGVRWNISRGLDLSPFFSLNVEHMDNVAGKRRVVLFPSPYVDETFKLMSDETIADWPSTRRRPIAFEDWRRVDESLAGEFT